MKRTIPLLTAVCGVAMLAGCLPLEAEDEFRDAIPEEPDLMVKIGSHDVAETGPTALLDPYAEAGCEECCIQEVDGEEWYVDGDLYQLTRDAKWYINGGLAVAMGWVWHIVNSPVSEETDDGYIWGPWQESLSRIEFRFIMTRSTETKFSFRLEGKNINATEDAWNAVVTGQVRSTDVPHAVSGTLVLDYTAIHAIDTAHPTPTTGIITYTFDVTKYPYTVTAEFDGFAYEPDGVLDATYVYRRLDAGMAGELTFDVTADIWPEEAPDGALETIAVQSRWTASGEGKAEATMTGGTLLGEDINVERGVFDECWADSDGLYYTTYQGVTVDYTDGSPSDDVVGCGAIDHCPDID